MTNSRLKVGQLNVDRKDMNGLINRCISDKYDILLLSDMKLDHGIKSDLATVITSSGQGNDAAIVILNKNLILGKTHLTDCYALVEIKNMRFHIGALYVRPINCLDAHENTLSLIKNLMIKRKRWCILGGDMNAHVKGVGYHKKNLHKKHSDLYDWIIQHGWSVLNSENVHTFTHKVHGGKSTPDWSLSTVDMVHRISWEVDLNYDGFSDHRMIHMGITCDIIDEHSRTVVRMGFFLRSITDKNRDTDPAVWYQHYMKAIESATVVRQAKPLVLNVPPKQRDMKNKITYLDRLIKRQGVNADPRIIAGLRDLKLEYRYYMKCWRLDRTKSWLNTINTDNAFKILTNPLKRKNYSISHIMVGNERIVDQEVMINMILDHFFPYEEPDNFDDIISDGAFSPPINTHEIGMAISSFAANKAPGMDGIDIKMIKAWRGRDKEYIDSIWTHWWNTCTFPEELKIANMIVLIKNVDNAITVNNVRLIGLLSIMGKVFERIISWRIGKQLLTDKRLLDNQFGFLPGRSCEMAVEKIHMIRLDNKHRVEILAALDIKSAFDKIRHKSLINELNKMNIPRNIIEMLKSYFSGRMTRLQIGNVAKTIQVNRGLVQGSKLSPLCFVAAIDRVLRAAERIKTSLTAKLEIIAYCDDITLVLSHEYDYNMVRQALAKTLSVITEELDILGLRLSPEKMVIVTNVHKPPGSIMMRGTVISLADQAKILGVIFSKDFKYDKHLQYVEKKLNLKLDKLRYKMKAGDWLDLEVKKKVAKQVLFPMITYGSNVWFKDTTDIRATLRRMYKVIMAIVLNAHKTASFTALSMLSGLTPLHIICVEKEMKLRQKLSLRSIDNIPLSARTSICDYPDPWACPDVYFKGKIYTKDDHNLRQLVRVIYTDGSKCIEPLTGKSKVGAALVVMYNNKVIETRKFKLFHYTTVFEAEGLAILQACQYADQQNWNTVDVISDSLSTIEALVGYKWKNRISLDIIKFILAKRLVLNLWWCKSHVGIIGNEYADKAAKEASANGILLFRPAANSYGDKLIREVLRGRRETEFNEDQYGRTVKQFVSSVFDETHKFMKITRETTQIYTGHGPYMSYYYEIGLAPNNACCCSESVQDSRHLLYECKHFVKENFHTALKCGLSATDWHEGWESVVKKKQFHLMIRIRAWSINSEISKINYMRILPREIVASMYGRHSTESNFDLE